MKIVPSLKFRRIVFASSLFFCSTLPRCHASLPPSPQKQTAAAQKKKQAGPLIPSSLLQEMKNDQPVSPLKIEDRYEDGKMKVAVLLTDAEIQGIMYKTGTRLFFNPGGSLFKVLLSADTNVNGVIYKAGSILVFLPNRKLIAAKLSAETDIHGLKCNGGTVHLDEDELVRRWVPPNDTEVQGILYKAAPGIFFHKNKVEKGYLAADTDIGKYKYKGGMLLLSHADGQVKGGYLAAPATIEGIRFEAGDPVGFSEDGKLLRPEYLVDAAAALLSRSGEWRDLDEAEYTYNFLKKYNNLRILNVLVQKVRDDEQNRLQLLFLAVKLGIPGSEARLAGLLDKYGSKDMAEAFMNCGSSRLDKAGKRWAKKHGYEVHSRPGSASVKWGEF